MFQWKIYMYWRNIFVRTDDIYLKVLWCTVLKHTRTVCRITALKYFINGYVFPLILVSKLINVIIFQCTLNLALVCYDLNVKIMILLLLNDGTFITFKFVRAVSNETLTLVLAFQMSTSSYCKQSHNSLGLKM